MIYVRETSILSHTRTMYIDLSERFLKPVIIQQASYAGSSDSFQWLPYHLGLHTNAISVLELDIVLSEEFTVMFLNKPSLSLCYLALHYRVLSDSIKFWEAEN